MNHGTHAPLSADERAHLARDSARAIAVAHVWASASRAFLRFRPRPDRPTGTTPTRAGPIPTMPPSPAALDTASVRARAARPRAEAPDRLDGPEATATCVWSVAAGRVEVARARAKEAARLARADPRTIPGVIPPGLVCSARLP